MSTTALSPKPITMEDLISHPGLSWKAKGLAIAIAHQHRVFDDPDVPDKWSLLADTSTDKYSSIQAGLKELENAGILIKTTHRQPNGPIIGSSWRVGLTL